MVRYTGVLLLFLSTFLGGQTLPANCYEFSKDQFGFCTYERQIPWIAYGGGWTSTFRWANVRTDSSVPGEVTVHISLISRDGKPGTIGAYVHDNRTPSVLPTSGVSYPLWAGESVEAVIKEPLLCPSTYDTCQPDPANPLIVGSLWVRYSAWDAESLRGLAPSSLSFVNCGSDGVCRQNATEYEALSQQTWKSQISVSMDGKVNTSMAVSNPTDYPLFVDINLYDERGTFTASAGKLYLAKHETRGFDFRSTVGDKLFPRNRDFTGYVEVAVVREPEPLAPGTDPRVNIVVFQFVGESMGSLPAYPAYRK